MKYPAVVYKNPRCHTYIANCVVKNLLGFGKTETEALDDLKKTIQKLNEKCEIILEPCYGLV